MVETFTHEDRNNGSYPDPALGGSQRVSAKMAQSGRRSKGPIACHERHDRGLDASAEAEDGQR